MIPDYEPSQQKGDSLSETWRDPNKPKLKNIKDEDVAYELRELSKYTSLSPEVINIICHGYARICQLERERDEVRRLLKAVVDMVRDNMAPDAMHPKHVCDFIYCPEIATCMVCENWTDALVMCYPDDFQDEEETK